MVSESQKSQLRELKRGAEERAAIVRGISENMDAMDETSIQTRELIAETRALIRRMDRLLASK
jgi:methyl-accepting chemotaxis protein